ncbi:hypothetical protein [Streptomyces sp. NPDC029674]|uniref:hypothetical protein n=1 Tax=Streptomyces sp. NPDC029674 TaxID=3365297 RepID=UPI0038506368
MRLCAALILGLALAAALPSAAHADIREKAPVPACSTYKAPLKIEEENKSWYSPNGQVALTLTDDNSLVRKGPDGKEVFSTTRQADSNQDGYAALQICDDSTMRIVSGPNLLWSAP